MRCSDCSRLVSPIVAVDIDGTLADYHGHFLNFAAGYMRKEVNLSYDGSIPFKKWWMRKYGSNEHTWKAIKLAYRQGGMKRNAPAYPGATELCNAIRDAGSELWLTTTRPYLRLDGIDPDTRFWLEAEGIDYDGLLYDDFKYERLGELVDKERVVAVLDDLPDMWNQAARIFGHRIPILARNYYNKKVVKDSFASDLWGAKRSILSRIREWRENNNG